MIWKIFFISLSLLTICFISCGESEESQMRETVIEAVKAQSSCDVDRYLQYADFGEEPDSLHVTLLRSILARHKTVVERKGGVSDIITMPCTPKTDSLAYMGYTVRYLDGTQEHKIATLVKKKERWKMSVTQ